MKELMAAIEEEFGIESGIVIYRDLSGHIFVGSEDDDVLYFYDITKVTIHDVKNHNGNLFNPEAEIVAIRQSRK